MYSRRHYAHAMLASLIAVGLGALVYQAQRSPSRLIATPPGENKARPSRANPPITRELELPPVSSSRFLNTSLDVAYVGPQACVECHRDEHDSYLRTTHSRALAELDPSDEPDDVEFEHVRSGRDYQVYRKNGQMRHRESIRNPAGAEFVLSDYPIRYRIGSGNHSRSYLVETGGFLVEAPLTWYKAKQAWGMSPGYDTKVHAGFERTADIGCLYCHAGRVVTVASTRNRVNIHDGAISCENCHGPGAAHVAHHQQGAATKAKVDFTIVNPAQLSREASEAICAQCHLRAAASVLLRGRTMTDFRPGLTLADFRTDYVLEDPDQSMSVVGHVEQMKRSPCYQQSTTLTCTTCHNPHATPTDENRIDYFRQTCLGCHAQNDCGVDVEVRKKTDQQDNCITCHMPQRPTDIPHFAFTHHRIGLHEPVREDTVQGSSKIGNLVPLGPLSELPETDRVRGLGLAYLELSDKQASPAAFDAYRLRAARLLESVRQEGMRDGEVDAALARLYWERDDFPRAIRLAEDALRTNDSSGATANALFVLGDSQLALNHPNLALPALEALTELRRQSEDWVLIGVCHQASGQLEQAIVALEHAAEISPSRIDIHEMLAALYQAVGKPVAADQQRRIAQLLLDKR